MEAGLAYGECFVVERKRFLRDCDGILTRHPGSARDGIEMPFTFLAGGAFNGTAGKLIAISLGSNNYRIEGDIDGNNAADFAILVTSVTVPDASAFIL